MSAQPGRHRIGRNGGPGSASGAPKVLVTPGESSSAPRHARTVPSRYAVHIGRVGALAVSLGIGVAMANSATGVAFADGESDAGTSASSSTSASADGDATGAAAKTRDGAAAATGPAGDDTTDTDHDDESDTDEIDTDQVDDVDDVDTDTGADSGAAEDASDSGEEANDEDAVEVAEATGTAVVADAEPIKVKGAPARPAVAAQTAPVRAGTSAQSVPVTTGGAATAAVVPVTSLGVVTSNVVAPLVDPEVPAPSPVGDALMAWVRRLIVHTFFNKTPVVRSVETEQIVTGQVIITVDAYDPNGDPLTYEIVQPDGGLVFREPLTGKFVYTPAVPVLGDPVPVEFTVVIRDDSEHLTGVLGVIQDVLHRVSRFLGLAKPDNLTQAIGFEVDPILQVPPSALVVGGLPYLLGGDPVKLLTVAEITDADSPSLKEVTVSIGLGRVEGDALGWTAPVGSTIASTWINDWTLKLSGIASQADYENALKAVTFSATQLGLLARTVDITLIDQHDVANVVPAVVLAAVLPSLPLDAPPTLLAAGGAPYFLTGDPVKLLSAAEIADLDSASLKRALVTISLGRVNGDTLGYVPPVGSSIVVNQVDDHTIELSGPGSLDEYETALKAITFSATSLGLIARTVEITLTDADGVSSLAPALVAASVLPALDLEPPLVVIPVGVPVHTVGKAPVPLVTSVQIVNADGGMLTGAVVAIGLNSVAGDTLGFSAIEGNPVSVEQTNGWTLTLSGTGTVDQYQQVLKSITFSATQLGLPRTVTIDVTEADGDTSPAPGVVFANSVLPLRPTVTVASLPATYTIGKPGTVLTPTVLIEDLDSTVLTGATVSIGAGKQVGDALNYVAPPGSTIQVAGNGTAALTFSGTATREQYAAALQAVTFSATGGALIPRTFAFNVTDDSGLTALLSGVATAVVKAPDRPTVVTVGLSSVALPSVGDTVKPITLATIVDTDSAVLTSASVQITGGRTSGDTLGYSPIAGVPITATYDSATGELKLSGAATPAQYKQALEAVTFKATQFGGGWLELTHIRTLSVYVTDDSNASNTLPGVVTVAVLR